MAFDVNMAAVKNNPEWLALIFQTAQAFGLLWGGPFNPNDPVHFVWAQQQNAYRQWTTQGIVPGP